MMENLSEIVSFIKRRDVDLALPRNRLRVTRDSSLKLSGHTRRISDPARELYFITSSYNVDHAWVKRVLELAKEQTVLFGLEDDLDEVTNLRQGSIYDRIFKLTHALEHLSCVDLKARGLNKPTKGFPMAYTGNLGGIPRLKFYLFYRDGVTNDIDAMHSLQRALDQIHSLS